jgi:hypothetical protein
VAYPASYNAPSEPEQLRSIERLEKAHVPLALIQAENIVWDGAPLSLRNFLIYRYLIDNFLPFKDEYGRIWMIRKNEVGRLAETGYQIAESEEAVTLLSEPFWKKNLFELPVSWGRAADTLSNRLTNPVDILQDSVVLGSHSLEEVNPREWKITGKDPFLVFQIPSGTKGDVLFIEMDREIPGTMAIFWTSNLLPEFGEQQYYVFGSESTHYMIPVSSAPSWYLSETVQQLRVDLPEQFSGQVKFEKILLFDRVIRNGD